MPAASAKSKEESGAAPRGMQDRESAGFERAFSAHASRKIAEIHTSIPAIFSFCLNEKFLAQNCYAPEKERFFCQARRKAQKYWICISSIFNEV